MKKFIVATLVFGLSLVAVGCNNTPVTKPETRNEPLKGPDGKVVESKGESEKK